AAADREHELLAGRVQPAGSAVEAVEDDPLDGRVDPARATGARLARVGDLGRRLVERTEPELERDERDIHRSFRRKTAARTRARPARPAQTKNAGLEARVIVASIALARSSRTAASAESWRAPFLSNGLARFGVSPACAFA